MTGERFDRRDALVAGALALGYLLLLVSTTKTLGYARDEGFYVFCARALEACPNHAFSWMLSSMTRVVGSFAPM